MAKTLIPGTPEFAENEWKEAESKRGEHGHRFKRPMIERKHTILGEGIHIHDKTSYRSRPENPCP